MYGNRFKEDPTRRTGIFNPAVSRHFQTGRENSPTIHPTLIPILYRLGQQREQPMTRLTDELILDALERVELPLACHDLLDVAKRVLRPSEPVQKEAA